MAEFTPIGAASELGTGTMKALEVAGVKIAVVRVGDMFHAFGNVCTHRGCPLSKGKLEETTVTCPCHGSQFDVTTGAVLRGPAEEPVRSYPIKVQGNELQVEM